MNRFAKTAVFMFTILTFASFAQAQTNADRRSALRPRPNASVLDPAPDRGNVARQPVVEQLRNVGEPDRQAANVAGHQDQRNARGHGGWRGHGNRHYRPSYPVDGNGYYGSGYYGYSIGNPGFNIPSYLAPANGVYGYNYGYNYGYGYGYGYGYPFYGYPIRGRLSITTESSRSNTPGSHYFGDPHASQYIPGQ